MAIERLSLHTSPTRTRKHIARFVGVGATYPLHTHTFYEYFLVTGGSALHMVNGTSQALSKGSLVLIRPEDAHYYDYYNQDDFDFVNMGIAVSEFERACAYYGVDPKAFSADRLPPQVMLGDDDRIRLEALMDQMIALDDGPAFDRVFSYALSSVLFHILDGQRAEADVLPEWLMRLIREMEKPENYVAGLPRMLAMSNCTQAHLNRTFRRYLYTTPTRFINDLRLHRASRMLMETEATVASVCAACGFNNASHFYQQYRRHFGCSPAESRRPPAAATDPFVRADAPRNGEPSGTSDNTSNNTSERKGT